MTGTAKPPCYGSFEAWGVAVPIVITTQSCPLALAGEWSFEWVIAVHWRSRAYLAAYERAASRPR